MRDGSAVRQRLGDVRGGSDPDRSVERAREVDGHVARDLERRARRLRPWRASRSPRRRPRAARAARPRRVTTLSSAASGTSVRPRSARHLLERGDRLLGQLERPPSPRAARPPRRETRPRSRPRGCAHRPAAPRARLHLLDVAFDADLQLEGLETARRPSRARCARRRAGAPGDERRIALDGRAALAPSSRQSGLAGRLADEVEQRDVDRRPCLRRNPRAAHRDQRSAGRLDGPLDQRCGSGQLAAIARERHAAAQRERGASPSPTGPSGPQAHEQQLAALEPAAGRHVRLPEGSA